MINTCERRPIHKRQRAEADLHWTFYLFTFSRMVFERVGID